MLVPVSERIVQVDTYPATQDTGSCMPRYALGKPEVGGVNLFYVHDHDNDIAAETKALAWLTEAFPDRTVRGSDATAHTEAELRNVLMRVTDDLALDAGFLLPEANDNSVAEFIVEPPASS